MRTLRLVVYFFVAEKSKRKKFKSWQNAVLKQIITMNPIENKCFAFYETPF
jgi:hypothetical protein